MEKDHLLSIRDVTRERIDEYDRKAELFRAVDDHPLGRRALTETYRGTGAALFFEEPSTRTFVSFKMAMKKLGVEDIALSGATAATQKGETLGHTAITLGALKAETLVMRTKEEGAVAKAAEVSDIPIINAGDGANEHPSQAILDIVTIRREFGKVAGLRLGVFGDVGYARVLNSLMLALGYYPDVEVAMVPSAGLGLTLRATNFVEESGLKVYQMSDLRDLVDFEPHALYAIRSQAERHKGGAVPNSVILMPEIMDLLHNPAALHAGPHGPEIPESLYSHPRAIFAREQVSNGLYTRMALIDEKLGSLAFRRIQNGEVPYNEEKLAA